MTEPKQPPVRSDRPAGPRWMYIVEVRAAYDDHPWVLYLDSLAYNPADAIARWQRGGEEAWKVMRARGDVRCLRVIITEEEG